MTSNTEINKDDKQKLGLMETEDYSNQKGAKVIEDSEIGKHDLTLEDCLSKIGLRS